MNHVLYVMVLWLPLASCIRQSAFDRIETINSQYATYSDGGRYFQVDVKLPPLKKVPLVGKQNDNRFYAPLRRDDANLWPNGIIPYKLSYSIRRNDRTYKILKNAMEEWEKKTCIKFVERTNQPDYVEFYYGDGCNSDVGRVGGRQTTSLGRGCAHHGIIVHELGHVIGFWHEQNRPDRDAHVQIMWENIVPKFQFAFTKYSTRKIDSLNVPYDYYSVMHYGSKAFTKNQKPTIQSLKPGITEFGNTRISNLDAKQANLLYNCPGHPKFPKDFFWSSRGPGDHTSVCIHINEPLDPNGWHDNYLCHRNDRKSFGFKWSNNGALKGMSCTPIKAEGAQHYWGDNFLCWPHENVVKFVLKAGALTQDELNSCLNITEPDDPIWSKKQYHLCVTRDQSPVDGKWAEWSPWGQCSRQCGGGIRKRLRTCSDPPPSHDGKFCIGITLEQGQCNERQCEEWPRFPDDFSIGSHQYPPAHKLCIRTYERLDYFKWNKYLLCTPNNKRDLELHWSDRGPIAGKLCTRIYVPAEVRIRRGTWDDNYLCMPKNGAPYRFRFSSSGPLNNADCLRWYAKEGKDGWDNTYLCVERISSRWSPWSTWSSCSETCGGGTQARQRTCSLSSDNGNCVGPQRDERRCNVKNCPISCGGRLIGDGGQFTSPHYPNDYPDNSDCIWVIRAPRGKVISLRFHYFDIEGPSCRYDFLTVRDGPSESYPKLGTFCGSQATTVKSTGNHLWVRFKSDDRINHRGFDISWSAVSDPQVTIAKSAPSSCGGMVTKDQGSLSSPRFPAAYPHDMDCTWVIKGSHGKRLHVWFDHFYIDTTHQCQGDYVEIKNGESFQSPTLGRFCGSKSPAPFKSHSNSLRIQLHTDSTRHHRGFRVRWRSVNLPQVLPTPAARKCPVGWEQRQFRDQSTQCYLVKRNEATWSQAWWDCKYNHADLLCLTSKEEENYIINDINRMYRLGKSVLWLGINDLANEGVWVWCNNSNNTYKNWAPGDPNNGGNLNNEDCGVLKADGQWNDYPCDSKFKYICKAEPQSSSKKTQRRRIL